MAGGTALLALALPLAAAELARLPAASVQRAVQQGEPVVADRLAQWLVAEGIALNWRAEAEGRLRRAMAQIVLAESAPPAAAPGHLRAAEDALQRGLRRAPGSATGWTRLALVRHRLGDSPEAVADALERGVRLAPRNAKLAPIRAELAILHWPEAAAVLGEATLNRQLRLAWRQAPKAIQAAARESGRLALLQRAITETGGDPATLRRQVP